MAKEKLTTQQKIFVYNILEGMNQTDAYIAASYKCSRSTARRNAARLMTNADIVELIVKGQQKAANEADITQESILREYGKIAFADVPKKDIKPKDQLKALNDLARILGMFNNKLDLDFNAETLNAILSGLPEDFAAGVREALTKMVSERRVKRTSLLRGSRLK